ncbi:MAG: aspartyl protease family protein, partial [Candidatus Korobacteraceae bacterium]
TITMPSVGANPQSSAVAVQSGNSGAANSALGAPNSALGAANSALGEADQLFGSGKIAEAAARYQALANADPKLVAAQVGLVRCYLLLQKLDDARAAAEAAIALQPNSWLLQLTLGDVRYAEGRIPEAERAYVKAENLKPDEPSPYLGLARVYRVYSLYRRAYDNLKRAHELAPNELQVQLLWFNALPHQERILALEAYLANPAVNPQVGRQLQQYLAFLKQNADAPAHACKLVSKVGETDTKLYALARPGTKLGASGLAVKINNQETRLALDTGASGVLLGRTSAEKLGLKRLAYQAIVGMGDSGKQGGYTAAVDRIRVGDLEFQDCIVRVTEAANPVTGEDGLIGADVFSSYLVDIDIPGAKLRLSPLPKRPDEAAHPAALQTLPQDSQELESESENSNAAAKAAVPAPANLPKDAYVAPEMANWSKALRFRSLLLVPTLVDHAGPLLFMIDTGSFANILSTRAAREITQIRSDPGLSVTGLSGSVAKVYRADKATLQFGHYEQDNQDVVTFDLTPVCKQTGTEVSGILGFNMLRILQTRIDYRDGLVDFVYDPKHLPKQVKLGK